MEFTFAIDDKFVTVTVEDIEHDADDGVEYDDEGTAWYYCDEDEVYYYFDEEAEEWLIPEAE